MKSRRLGKTGPMVSAIGLGCMGMTDHYGRRDDEAQAIATIHHALDHGVSLLNTLDNYGPHFIEELIGRALKQRPGQAILNTKFGLVRYPDGKRGVNGRPDHVVRSCEASLKRLGVDAIDIYTQHRVDPETLVEETVGALSRLVEVGKVRYIGLSEAGPETIGKAHAIHPLVCIETEYSLWSRDVEEYILPLCRKLGISLMPYAPLGRGFLSGSIRSTADLVPGDTRTAMPRFSGENFNVNLAKVQGLEEVAFAKGFKAAQVALAWVLHQDIAIVPIPGTKQIKHLNENIRAVDIDLTPDDLQKLDLLFAVGTTAGPRYPEELMRQLGV